MKKVKKKRHLFITLFLIALLLAGCGGSSQAETVHNDTVQTQNENVSAGAHVSDTGSTSSADVHVLYADKTAQAAAQEHDQEENPNPAGRLRSLSHEGYILEQVVVLSRHNIRSPLSGSGSVLTEITPHEWISWTSNPSELSLRGGALETMMGQYFRRWAEKERLFPENYQPDDSSVRIYANAKQRTIATAQFFATGLLPTAGLEVETHVEYDSMDPTFKPQLTFVNNAYTRDVESQVKELYGDDIASLADNYRLLEDVIDMEDSPAWRSGEAASLRTDDTELILKLNEEPNLSGSLKMGGRISDALVLQYYEEQDDEKAAFGHVLTKEQWQKVSEVKDTYQEILFATPLLAPNVAHPLLIEVKDELENQNRKFSFLCGHDSNIGSVLASLGAEDYTLPDSIEKKVPIGSKLVFSRWTDADSNAWISVNLVYQTADQLRGLTLLDIDTPPAIFPIALKHLEMNADGLYAAQDVMNRFDQAITEYGEIIKKYEKGDDSASPAESNF